MPDKYALAIAIGMEEPELFHLLFWEEIDLERLYLRGTPAPPPPAWETFVKALSKAGAQGRLQQLIRERGMQITEHAHEIDAVFSTNKRSGA